MFKKLLEKLKGKIKEKIEEWIDDLVSEENEEVIPEKKEDISSGDEIDFSKLSFCWGGFNGSHASESKDAQIKNLRIGSNLSYQWENGGCENLGAPSRTAAECLACLFIKSGNSWKGGKFDWISSSRLTRDFKNIEAGYGGWNASEFHVAKEFSFVILSKDGKHRTNTLLLKK